MSGRIFISYRRDLSSDTAGKIALALRQHLPRCDPFLDVDKIKSDQFYNRIETELALTEAVLVLIPPDWEHTANEHGVRIQQEGDFVRHEVATALRRGVGVIPVLVDRETLPDADDLPDDLRELSMWHATNISSDVGPADVFRLTEVVRPKLPGRLTAVLIKLIAVTPATFLLPYILSTALLLFASHLLQIQFIDTPFTAIHQIETGAFEIIEGTRDLGFFQALNWTVVLIMCWPILFFISHQLLRESQAVFDSIRKRGLIVFIAPTGEQKPRPPDPIFRNLLKFTSISMLLLVVLTIFLSGWNWFHFSGKWPVENFPMGEFLQNSTGPDWQVAWSLSTFDFSQNSLGIKIFAFICYELYNLGWITNFCIFIYAIFLVTELDNIAQSAGDYKAEKLVLDGSDPVAGGLDSFDRIHRLLAIAVLLGLATMYLMAIRNFFLPPGCRAIELLDGTLLSAHCFHTLGILQTSIQVFWDIITNLNSVGLGGFETLGTLPNSHNSFTMGAFYTVGIFVALFLFASIKMISFVRKCQENSGINPSGTGAGLVQKIQKRVRIILAMSIIGVLAILFPITSVIFILALLTIGTTRAV
ncbi:MAG: hypothetical protein AB8B94_06505 [Hyphomicrobiales bacterium]